MILSLRSSVSTPGPPDWSCSCSGSGSSSGSWWWSWSWSSSDGRAWISGWSGDPTGVESAGSRSCGGDEWGVEAKVGPSRPSIEKRRGGEGRGGGGGGGKWKRNLLAAFLLLRPLAPCLSDDFCLGPFYIVMKSWKLVPDLLNHKDIFVIFCLISSKVQTLTVQAAPIPSNYEISRYFRIYLLRLWLFRTRPSYAA